MLVLIVPFPTAFHVTSAVLLTVAAVTESSLDSIVPSTPLPSVELTVETSLYLCPASTEIDLSDAVISLASTPSIHN